MKEKIKELRTLVPEYLNTTNLYEYFHITRFGSKVIVNMWKYKEDDLGCVYRSNDVVMSKPESEVDKLIKFFKSKL